MRVLTASGFPEITTNMEYPTVVEFEYVASSGGALNTRTNVFLLYLYNSTTRLQLIN